MKKSINEKEQCVQTDVKCRFFAQYLMQRVWRYSHSNGEKVLLYIDKNTMYNKGYQGILHSFLELKPITEISNEDAIECAKMFKWLQITENPELWNHPVTKEKVVKMNDHWKYGICILSIENLNINQIDYLRSKGYALPFMEHSVDELVKMGWVQLV